MKVITLEEHFSPAAVPGVELPKGGLPPLEQGTNVGAAWLEDPGLGVEIVLKRLARMDEDGVTIQVISTPFAQDFGVDVAVDYCRRINDRVRKNLRSQGHYHHHNEEQCCKSFYHAISPLILDYFCRVFNA